MQLTRTALRKLKEDFEINNKLKIFEGWPGEQITFEEFLMMMLIEKDLALKLEFGRDVD